MKIALACRVYPTHRPGGMPFVCQDRARELAAMGHEVHVLTTGPAAELRDEGVAVHHLPCPTGIYSAQYADACRTWCQANRPELIHLDSFDGGNLWWADRPGGAQRVGITMHGCGPGALLTSWNMHRLHGNGVHFDAGDLRREAAALAKADVVIGVSGHEYWCLRDFYGLANAALIYNPIPAYFFDNPTDRPKGKGYYLCAAVSGAVMRGFGLAADAAQRAHVELRAVRNVPREQMPAVYDEALALVLPTLYAQGYDLAVAECHARRRPVIASDTGSYFAESRAFVDDDDRAPRDWYTFTTGSVDELTKILTEGVKLPVQPWVGEHMPVHHAQKWLRAMKGDHA